ncbi:MAG TPA: methyl-accepting chemotaxis protein, partial [Burkholderiaceae bacterium]|nr:methyl-accepting chemotaxis protein [Burkholderiaceae bacterium]
SEAMQDQAGKLAQVVAVFRLADASAAALPAPQVAAPKLPAPPAGRRPPAAKPAARRVAASAEQDWEEF